MTTWIKDNNGNKCSVEHFGSREAAQAALDSLSDCRDCTDCRNCTNCRDCTDCRDCVGCINCFCCVDCGQCIECVSCDDCRDCRYCSGCINCFCCEKCTGCGDSTYCTHSSKLTCCHSCRFTSNCRRCVLVDHSSNCEGLLRRSFESRTQPELPFPAVERIHSKVFQVVKNDPNLLEMDEWHSPCGTIHCRAGWMVTLAGDWYKELEESTSTLGMAMLICHMSNPFHVPRISEYFSEKYQSIRQMEAASLEEDIIS